MLHFLRETHASELFSLGENMARGRKQVMEGGGERMGGITHKQLR